MTKNEKDAVIRCARAALCTNLEVLLNSPSFASNIDPSSAKVHVTAQTRTLAIHIA